MIRDALQVGGNVGGEQDAMLAVLDVFGKDVAKYESQYVKAIKKGDYESLAKLYANSQSSGAEILRTLVVTLSKMFKLMSSI